MEAVKSGFRKMNIRAKSWSFNYSCSGQAKIQRCQPFIFSTITHQFMSLTFCQKKPCLHFISELSLTFKLAQNCPDRGGIRWWWRCNRATSVQVCTLVWPIHAQRPNTKGHNQRVCLKQAVKKLQLSFITAWVKERSLPSIFSHRAWRIIRNLLTTDALTVRDGFWNTFIIWIQSRLFPAEASSANEGGISAHYAF